MTNPLSLFLILFAKRALLHSRRRGKLRVNDGKMENSCSGTTRYFGLSLYDNDNDFYSPCTYERRTTYRSLSPILNIVTFLVENMNVLHHVNNS